MRKTTIYFMFFLIFMGDFAIAQGVGIGTSDPDPSAALDIVQTDKGVLLPRLTTIQRTTMANPVQSLLVFDINTNSFWWRDGAKWVELASSNGLNDSDLDTGVDVEQSEDEDEVVINLAGIERARFFGDQLYLKDKISLGTYSKRGMITLQGPDEAEFGPTMYMYGISSNQSESGRLRFVEGTVLGNWKGGFIHYNGSAKRMHLGTHNDSDNLASSDFNAMTIKRANGFVGINDEDPLHRLSVNGDIKINEGGITIETNQQEIVLQAGTATVTISADGNISITSATGNLEMSANNINITASNNIVMSAGENIVQTAGIDISENAGGDIEVISNNNIVSTASNSILTDANIISLNAETDMSLTSGTNFTNVAGGDVSETAGGNIELISNDDISVAAGQSVTTTAGTNLVIDATMSMAITSGVNYINTAGGNTTINTGGITKILSVGKTDILGSTIDLNGSSNGKAAARVTDITNTPSGGSQGVITQGSGTVFIGN
ncbi:MAG: hypothetical protein ACJA1A_001116 [Saprospiraceae bacterium]|jgi:hypothetical protein